MLSDKAGKPQFNLSVYRLQTETLQFDNNSTFAKTLLSVQNYSKNIHYSVIDRQGNALTSCDLVQQQHERRRSTWQNKIFASIIDCISQTNTHLCPLFVHL